MGQSDPRHRLEQRGDERLDPIVEQIEGAHEAKHREGGRDGRHDIDQRAPGGRGGFSEWRWIVDAFIAQRDASRDADHQRVSDRNGQQGAKKDRRVPSDKAIAQAGYPVAGHGDDGPPVARRLADDEDP
jgi:hypothetical protein